MVPQVGNAQRHAIVTETKSDHTDPAHHHRDDGDDLDQGEPELEFTEGFHRDQVDRAHADQGGEGPGPARHIGKPDPHVHRHRGDFRHAGHQPQEPVVPAGQKSRQRAQVILCITAERAGDGVVHRHFAQGAHDHQNRQTADDVGQHDGRTGHLNGLGRTEEQSDTDTGAKGHQTNMSFAQFTFERSALGSPPVGQMVVCAHRNTTSSCYWI